MYQTIVIGCGIAGITAARELAETKGHRVLVIESRDHIGGNCYDKEDTYGVRIHPHGPHIFHTNNQQVYEYLSRFTKWHPYEHEVVGNVYGMELPIPFNLNTLEVVYGVHAPYLEQLLIQEFGEGKKVPILTLKNHPNEELQKLAEYIYENIFLHYTKKQWGLTPEQLDESVSGRVPIFLSRDNRYFQDEYQGMPKDGYTKMFENMLAHEKIDLWLGCDAKNVLSVKQGEPNPVRFEGKNFNGNIIFTGAPDDFFDGLCGKLSYRSLRFACEHYEKDFYQSHGVVNYTVTQDYTRISEYKHMTGQKISGTTIMKEYPASYERGTNIPYYTVNNEESEKIYKKYEELAKKIPRFYLLGRLAEYRYYNMDAAVERALALTEEIH